MSVDPSKLPPLAQSTVGDVEIVCCLSCCPLNWFTRAKTPQPQSPGGFNPKLEPVAKAIVEEVQRQRAASNASRRPSLVAAATGIADAKDEQIAAKVETIASVAIKAGRGAN